MKTTMINDYIYQYAFIEDEKNPFYVVNITVVLDEGRALIIDTAFSQHAQMVKKVLKDKGFKPEIVVLSHFHPDHACGAKEFDDCELIGSAFYKFNFDNCKEWCPDHEFIEPTIRIEDAGTLKFGKHKITFIHTPGHCKCSIVTIINDEIIHVGDLVMKTSDGKKMLPYISGDGSFKEHIRSLYKILDLDCNIMLLSHGDYIMGKSEIREEIEAILFYLTKVEGSSGKLPLEECLKGEITGYSMLTFHEKNIKQLG
jgi:glyoxylase-like metal-dependent hydrolase (beta-lactamase superfamily II)